MVFKLSDPEKIYLCYFNIRVSPTHLLDEITVHKELIMFLGFITH